MGLGIEPRATILEGGRVTIIAILLAQCAIWAVLGKLIDPLSAQAQVTPVHDRPYLLPEPERTRIKDLIATETWAQNDFRDLRERHEIGDSYASAFLYALEQDEAYLPPARGWLLEYGRQGGDLKQRAFEADADFFRGGQPWLGDVYYRTDIRPLVAYDWIYSGLTTEERMTIEAGILASARFRMRAMDRWSHTPNLVFKPTFMVAVAGLVTGEPELLTWGFLRKPWSSRGGYLPVLNLMIQDGGPWGEAPIYPIAHKSLLLMSQMSRLLTITEGQDWFARAMPGGGSPKALMDYFIDTAYPLERTGYGPGQIRIATYGDGATSAQGDLFLVNPAGPGLDLHQELAEAYNVSRDASYAAFLAMIPDYRPNLIDRPPLDRDAGYPPAPSKVWPDYGIAMLRSDESPAYWTSDEAIAVFQIMSQGYGHDHRDKFGIMLHGAGRLLYPDYNAVQYENFAIGWTRNTVAHNTVVVDEEDTQNATPTSVRSDFRPAVKFLATSASGVFDNVDQTRALLLTRDYLLDVFHLTSAVPHTYDYLLHSLGRPVPDRPDAPTTALQKRYWRLDDSRGATRDEKWLLDFVLDGPATRRKEKHDIALLKETDLKRFEKRFKDKFRFGPEWYAQRAAVRVIMAAEPETLVAYGRAPHALGMLVARRAGRRDTAFVATHEPFAAEDRPEITGVSVMARSAEALVVRIDAKDYTDYAAIALGTQKGEPEHVLATANDPATRFAFRTYGYLRVARDGLATAWGGWTGFRVPYEIDTLEVNGSLAKSRREGGYRVYGQVSKETEPVLVEDPESPLRVDISPAPARVFERDRRKLTVAITNDGDYRISGRLVFEPPPGLRIEPETLDIGPLPPGAEERLEAMLVADNPAPGTHSLHYRLHHPLPSELKSTRMAADELSVMVGAVLDMVYQHPKPAIYLVHAPKFTAAFEMFHGLCRYLADDDGTVRLDGAPLFTFSDNERGLLSLATDKAQTWSNESPASIQSRVYDIARFRIDFVGDRMVIRMDPDWTRPEEIHFNVPGRWHAPEGRPGWAAIAAEGGEHQQLESLIPGPKKAVSAAELAFPDSARSLCFQFLPPQAADFTEAGIAFTLNSHAGDRWTVGFCPRGRLQDWRWKK